MTGSLPLRSILHLVHPVMGELLLIQLKKKAKPMESAVQCPYESSPVEQLPV